MDKTSVLEDVATVTSDGAEIPLAEPQSIVTGSPNGSVTFDFNGRDVTLNVPDRLAQLDRIERMLEKLCEIKMGELREEIAKTVIENGKERLKVSPVTTVGDIFEEQE